MNANIEQPAHLDPVDPLTIRAEGWIHPGRGHPAVAEVRMRAEQGIIGRTRLLYIRPDVCQALGLAPDVSTGFSLLASHPRFDAAGPLELEFEAVLVDGTEARIGTRAVSPIRHDYRGNHYGSLLSDQPERLRHRADVYGSGPSAAGGSFEFLQLARRYLGSPPLRVIDVGCGLGFYGRHLLEDGYDWLGVEVKEADCAELARLGLPHRRVDGRSLPFAEASFGAAMAVEVLEHIAEPDAFLREVRRVAARLLVSVPNIELIPYLQPYDAVPWHLLEADHKNFFTRWSLRALLARHYNHVEVMGYGQAPLRTVEGTRLDYHLFAVATA